MDEIKTKEINGEKTNLGYVIVFLVLFSSIFYSIAILNRIGNAMDAKYVESLVFLILLLPVWMGTIRGYYNYKNNKVSLESKLSLSNYAVVIWSVLAGVILSPIMLYGGTEMAGLGMMIVGPFFILFEALLSMYIFMPLVVYSKLLVNNKFAQRAIIIELGLLLLFVALNISVLQHCNIEGCGNSKALTRIAIGKEDSNFCTAKYAKKMDFRMSLPRLGMPLFFVLNNRSTDDYKDEDCMKAFADDKNDIQLCEQTGYNQEKCIADFIFKNPDKKQCENLSGDNLLRFGKNNDFCYFLIAVVKKDKSVCNNLKLDMNISSHSYINKNICEATANWKIQDCLINQLTDENVRVANEYPQRMNLGRLNLTCAYAVLKMNPSESECGELSNKSDKSSCFYQLAQVTLDNSYCRQVLDNFDRDSCTSAVGDGYTLY